MKKVMISQPMNGKSMDEIIQVRDRAIKVTEAMGYELVNTLFGDDDPWCSPAAMQEAGVENPPLCFLAHSLEAMAQCHAVFFCNGWEQTRGCQLEHDAAIAYGLEVLYENEIFFGDGAAH